MVKQPKTERSIESGVTPKHESVSTLTSLERVLAKRRKKAAYSVVPTHLEGVSLQLETEQPLDILKSTIGKLAILGKEFASRKFLINELTKQQAQPSKKIKEIAKTTEGLRGIQSETDNYKLNVYPSPTITWNIEKLKKSLGIAYSTVVSETLQVEISIPLGYETKKGPLDSELLKMALGKGLVRLGLPKEELAAIVDPSIVPIVNEAKLADLLEAGNVSLIEGTSEIQETWTITVNPLNQPSAD